MNQKSTYRICKNDIYLAAVFAAVSLLLFALFFLLPGTQKGNTAVVTIDGREYGRYDLTEDQTVIIENEHGRNVILISNNTLQMTEADCPDKYCVSKGTISNVGETVVCLPHRLVAEIISEGGEEPLVDAFVG